MKRILTFLAIVAFSTTALAQGLEPSISDLTPAWLETNATPRVLGALVDPESARIEWNYTTAIRESTEKIQNSEGKKVKTRVYFAVTCGTVNAKNRMGGYAGNSFVIVALWPTRLVVNIEDNAEGGSMCSDYIRRGIIVPRG